jgi:hypothetical protein
VKKSYVVLPVVMVRLVALFDRRLVHRRVDHPAVDIEIDVGFPAPRADVADPIDIGREITGIVRQKGARRPM